MMQVRVSAARLLELNLSTVISFVGIAEIGLKDTLLFTKMVNAEPSEDHMANVREVILDSEWAEASRRRLCASPWLLLSSVACSMRSRMITVTNLQSSPNVVQPADFYVVQKKVCCRIADLQTFPRSHPRSHTHTITQSSSVQFRVSSNHAWRMKADYGLVCVVFR